MDDEEYKKNISETAWELLHEVYSLPLHSKNKILLYNVSVNSKPDHPPRATPGDSHILVTPGVGFSLLCLARESAPGERVVVINQSSMILKKHNFCFVS